jgi:hypothetical protein
MPLRIRRPGRQRSTPKADPNTTTVSIRLPKTLLADLGTLADTVDDLTRNGLVVSLLETACDEARRGGVVVIPPSEGMDSVNPGMADCSESGVVGAPEYMSASQGAGESRGTQDGQAAAVRDVPTVADEDVSAVSVGGADSEAGGDQ